jgi:hypothetical protein
MILVFPRVERTLLSVAFDFNAVCHPEATCLSSPKDLGGPRESPAVFAGDQIARLAASLSPVPPASLRPQTQTAQTERSAPLFF